MRRVLKFVIHSGVTRIETADEPRWRAVGAQGHTVVAWCEATPGVGHVEYLGAVMTGEPVPPEGDYIGTAEQADGIVVHVYRGIPG